MAKFFIQSLAVQQIRKGVFAKVNPEKDDFENIDPKQYSQLGNPIYSNLEFPKKTYKWKDNEYNFDGLRIDTVLLTVNQSKNIVKTEIQGRNGTVKEYISDGDYSITVAGTIVSPDAKSYPRESINLLKTVLDIPLSLEVTAEFLNIWNISNVVVESYSFPQQQGTRNTQPFQITMLSDEPIELQINNEL